MTGVITIWRLHARRLGKTAFSGDGAARYGFRWNLAGTRVVYCAESRALAAMESLVHVQSVADLAAVKWQLTAVVLPMAWIERPLQYPSDWDIYPYAQSTQHFGSKWARSRSTVALRVPSAVVNGEYNYVLNPEHPDFIKLDILPGVPFQFDARLFGEKPR